ncbi:MAG TPA: chemotaxis protein CheC [Bacillus sp. (in: firmicutes)]|uniref:chemotaxis protein CheC n=1 Tax=Bacillus litorisediminis TaxID=2922713 RepID=UPI001FAC8691|nr:chemotaxis protein CheC [Bacillus litorisediminis]HWO77978.1 chemotaxis protein CheC [Bacillus sp. (in: firmicutes)]
MDLYSITHFHLDILKEVGNIGAGHAATALSALLGEKVDMEVPSVRLASYDEMVELSGGSETTVTAAYLTIHGDINGQMFFVLPVKHGERFVEVLLNEPVSFLKPPFSSLSISVLEEIGNIVSGSYLSALSDFSGLKLQPSVPAVSIDMFGAIITHGMLEMCTYTDSVIVIETYLHSENWKEEKVNGYFLLLPDPESIPVLFRSLGVEQDDE